MVVTRVVDEQMTVYGTCPEQLWVDLLGSLKGSKCDPRSLAQPSLCPGEDWHVSSSADGAVLKGHQELGV